MSSPAPTFGPDAPVVTLNATDANRGPMPEEPVPMPTTVPLAGETLCTAAEAGAGSEAAAKIAAATRTRTRFTSRDRRHRPARRNPPSVQSAAYNALPLV